MILTLHACFFCYFFLSLRYICSPNINRASTINYLSIVKNIVFDDKAYCCSLVNSLIIQIISLWGFVPLNPNFSRWCCDTTMEVETNSNRQFIVLVVGVHCYHPIFICVLDADLCAVLWHLVVICLHEGGIFQVVRSATFLTGRDARPELDIAIVLFCHRCIPNY